MSTRDPERGVPFMPAPPLVAQRDDGTYEVGIDGLGPFPTRTFAEAVASQAGRAAR
jgi:hypothetical protein